MIVFILILIDLVAVLCSYQLAYLVRTGILPKLITFPFPEPLPFVLVNPIWLPLLFLFFYWFEQLYSRKYPFWEEIRQICKASLLASLAGFSIVSIGKLSDEVSRTVLIFTFLNSLWIVPMARLLGKRAAFGMGIGKRKIIIIGAGLTGELFLKSIRKEKTIGYDVIGFLDDDEKKKGTAVNNVKVLGKISEIDSYLSPGIEVVVAIPGMASEKMVHLVNLLQKKVKKVSFVPDLFGIPFLQSDMDFFFDNQVLLLNVRNTLKSEFNRVVKNTFDLILSLLIMSIALPFILLISILIRVNSRGNPIYGHERIGHNGKKFKCLKFRTMYFDSDLRLKELLEKDETARKEWEKNYKIVNDPRITKIGGFLRKTSLDEIPQLFNIFMGQMSLVGPRPVLQEELDKYYGEYSEYYYDVYPGLTGLWQVSGRSGVDYKKRVSLDVWYVSNWSLWLDVVILIRTVKAVFKRDGAY
ncbi:MAG: hypothetical protein A2452_04720 [Candidatus Firestonebacteria bacterium RIFOXYC2_FULL_39_67]|nr:MAG: hypothetical protein A2536_11690 [Candidatus Firestonebacteria bacterium RIFOXYD2_FULL_39_29]OGF55006.1 MAG: hypothetical protein A2497_03860 [Candidatus Firestonebacteria bacterium RifOxyC12_full_39_7]OGF55889.1 MAG: hypothetical protein A2452_04720 [Candidatus Firestonebacteria bacterium RIFOXYC2_FULL_39_67]